MDYCFLRNREGQETVATLVLKDKANGAFAAHIAPYKGGDSDWVVDQVCRDILKWGIVGDVVLRHDQERALEDLSNQVKAERARKQRTTTLRQFDEESPVGESQSNGYIEAGVRTFEGMLRTHRFALEERLQAKIDAHSAVFAWLV